MVWSYRCKNVIWYRDVGAIPSDRLKDCDQLFRAFGHFTPKQQLFVPKIHFHFVLLPTPRYTYIMILIQFWWIFGEENFFLSFFLGVAKTYLNHWTKRVARVNTRLITYIWNGNCHINEWTQSPELWHFNDSSDLRLIRSGKRKREEQTKGKKKGKRQYITWLYLFNVTSQHKCFRFRFRFRFRFPTTVTSFCWRLCCLKLNHSESIQ